MPRLCLITSPQRLAKSAWRGDLSLQNPSLSVSALMQSYSLRNFLSSWWQKGISFQPTQIPGLEFFSTTIKGLGTRCKTRGIPGFVRFIFDVVSVFSAKSYCRPWKPQQDKNFHFCFLILCSENFGSFPFPKEIHCKDLRLAIEED